MKMINWMRKKPGKLRRPVIHMASAFSTLVMALASTVALSNTSPAVVAYVSNVGTYDDGAIFVFFDRPISSCSSTGRLDLHAGHPARKEVLSIAMTAFVTGGRVKVHPGGCNGSYPTFDAVGDTYMYLTADAAT